MNLMLRKLREYFTDRTDVAMAFVFGSRARRRAGAVSDWDIAVYFAEDGYHLEWENDRNFPREQEVTEDLVKILQTDGVDLVVLNRAPADLAASAISGTPLVVKDRRLYLEFMLAVSSEAEDYRQTVGEYAEIFWRAQSLSSEDKAVLKKRLLFLESELVDTAEFRKLTRTEYLQDRMKRRQVERWIENLVNVAIDIAKTILAGEKRPIPNTYREILQNLDVLPGFPDGLGQELAQWTDLRNILAHEYLDIRWKRIEDFVKKSEPGFRRLVEVVKSRL